MLWDLDTQRVCRRYDFTKAQLHPPSVVFRSGQRQYRRQTLPVIEPVRPDTGTPNFPLFLLRLTAPEGRL
jgi:hypothetical protein